MGSSYTKIKDSNRVKIIAQTNLYYNISYLNKNFNIKLEDIKTISREINWKTDNEILCDLIAIYIDNNQNIEQTIKAIIG